MANNMITFEGNLASELNIRFTATGKQVASVNLIHNHTRKNSEGKYERNGKTTSMRAVLWQEMIEGRQFKKGDLLRVTGYLKERQWKDAQGQNHRLNELVVTDTTKHLPKGIGKPQAQPQPLEIAVVTEAEATKPKHKPRKMTNTKYFSHRVLKIDLPVSERIRTLLRWEVLRGFVYCSAVAAPLPVLQNIVTTP